MDAIRDELVEHGTLGLAEGALEVAVDRLDQHRVAACYLEFPLARLVAEDLAPAR